MQVKIYCPLWGLEDLSISNALAKIKQAGYDGVEIACEPGKLDPKNLMNLLADMELELVAAQVFAFGDTFGDYKKDFLKHLKAISELKPRFINSHTGKDFFSLEQNCELIQAANHISDDTGVKIVHETHRSRFAFCGPIMKYYLERLPNLRLTADFSHWCAVSESYLQDQLSIMEQAISRTDHIHARVGHPQGPQVSDPRAPEWKEALDFHLKWWDAILVHHQQTGSGELTITTEFGPEPYMQVTPYSQHPLADQWEINLFMKDLLDKRYNN